jgi:hypothetical protein
MTMVSGKLFETAPEEKPNADAVLHAPVPMPADHADAAATVTDTTAAARVDTGPDADRRALRLAVHPDSSGSPPSILAECSAEERVRIRAAKRRKKLLVQDAPA